MSYSKIDEISYYLPPINNLSKKDKLKFDKIFKKTGILNTRISKKNQDVIDLAYLASLKIKKKLNNVDGIIFVTQTPRYLLPSCACILQDKLKLSKNIFAVDINMGCSGYIYGLSVAKSLIESNVLKKILLVCADTYSKYIDKNNNSKYLFSDAASVTLISKSKKNKFGNFLFNTDGSKFDKIIIRKNQDGKQAFEMDGASVYAFTIIEIPKIIAKYLKMQKKNIKELKKIFFHQASGIILDTLDRKINNTKIVYKNIVYKNIKNIGNTTSSSIPISIKDALDKKLIKKNDEVLLCGFGVGLSWGVVSFKV